VFFEKRIPQNLPFVKKWKDMETQGPGRKAQKPTQNAASAADSAQKKLQKCGAPLVEQRKICYTVLHDAPSPSGKAGDFDSPIVGSTPAGATRRRPLHSFLCSGLLYFLFSGSLK
jgi:hypothetical protein